MKNRLILILGLLLFLGPALSQEPEPKKVKTLVDYRSQLQLTDQQIADIKTTLTNFQKSILSQRQQLQRQEAEFQNLLRERAALAEIKKKLREIGETRFQLRYQDVLTSRKVEQILSASQLEQWRSIQAEERAK